MQLIPDQNLYDIWLDANFHAKIDRLIDKKNILQEYRRVQAEDIWPATHSYEEDGMAPA
jgi:hypothetical protein